MFESYDEELMVMDRGQNVAPLKILIALTVLFVIKLEENFMRIRRSKISIMYNVFKLRTYLGQNFLPTKNHTVEQFQKRRKFLIIK